MIVLCVDVGGGSGMSNLSFTRQLTLGKTYEATEHNIGYRLINDYGEEETFRKERFIDIIIVRERKLNQLGI